MMAELPNTVSGRVDADGRLVAADPRLMALQLQAGGTFNGVLVVPQLATIARLAHTLGILVSRNVIAADGDNDLDLIVRAKPDGADVVLDIGGWATQKSVQRRLGLDLAPHAAEILWETDARLCFTRIHAPTSADIRVGQSLETVFRLEPDGDGHLPIIQGLARRVGYEGQPASLMGDEELPFMLSALPVHDARDKFIGWRGRASPRTAPHQRVFAEAEAEAMTTAILGTNSSHARGYARELSAALRPPLERIVAQADSIGGHQDGPLDPHYVEYAHDIATAARHLLGLVNDLTDVQTIESPDFKIDSEPLDLADIARRAASLLGVRAADRQVRIDAPSLDEVLHANGDFRRILQILVNLISNAVRYSPAGAVVWVRAEQAGDLAALVVADQGKGIPYAAHQQIFEKFARLDPNEAEGTGLGLYISRKLARAMGGDISVDSAPGQGARFVLTLPSVPHPTEAARPS